MSFGIGSDTVLKLIAAKVQDDRMHNSAKQFKIYTIRYFTLLISDQEKDFSFFLIMALKKCYSMLKLILFCTLLQQ